jgi:hypothetical protein
MYTKKTKYVQYAFFPMSDERVPRVSLAVTRSRLGYICSRGRDIDFYGNNLSLK